MEYIFTNRAGDKLESMLKNNITLFIGIVIGILLSCTYACADNISSASVEYTKSNGAKVTAQAAMNELYSSYYSSSQYTTYGANQYNSGYSKGVTDADGRANSNSVNYQTGYNAGVAAADARANGNSVNYQTGYNNGYNAGVSAADGRAAPGTVNYNSGWNAGVAAADGRAQAGTVNYDTGYNNGRAQGQVDKYPWNFKVSIEIHNSSMLLFLFQNDSVIYSEEKKASSNGTATFWIGYKTSYSAGATDWKGGYW